MTDRIKKLVDDLEAKEPHKRRGKTNRTFSLDADNVAALIRFCKTRQQPVSEVVDSLIADFVDELKKRGIE